MSEVSLTFEGGRYQEKLHSVLAKTAFLLDNTHNIEPEGCAQGYYEATIKREEKLYREVFMALYVYGICSEPSPAHDITQEFAYPTFDYHITARANARYDSGVFPRIQSGAIISTAEGYTSGFIARADLTKVTAEEYARIPKLTTSPSQEIDIVDDGYAMSQLEEQTPQESAEHLTIAELALDTMINEYTYRHIL